METCVLYGEASRRGVSVLKNHITLRVCASIYKFRDAFFYFSEVWWTPIGVYPPLPPWHLKCTPPPSRFWAKGKLTIFRCASRIPQVKLFAYTLLKSWKKIYCCIKYSCKISCQYSITSYIVHFIYDYLLYAYFSLLMMSLSLYR